MIGKTILHHKIIKKLGEGGIGEVYKIQDTKPDHFVALKFLPSQLTASDEMDKKLLQSEHHNQQSIIRYWWKTGLKSLKIKNRKVT